MIFIHHYLSLFFLFSIDTECPNSCLVRQFLLIPSSIHPFPLTKPFFIIRLIILIAIHNKVWHNNCIFVHEFACETEPEVVPMRHATVYSAVSIVSFQSSFYSYKNEDGRVYYCVIQEQEWKMSRYTPQFSRSFGRPIFGLWAPSRAKQPSTLWS